MKIGLYGGTFNPIHLGHTEAAKAVAESLGLDRLLLIPAGEPPHKKLTSDAASPEDRLEMTRLAAEAMGLDRRVEVLDIELKREGRSYTVDTVRSVRRQYPDAKLYLLMGTDMFYTFEKWYCPEEIARECTLAAFSRNESDCTAAFVERQSFLKEACGAKSVVVPLPNVHEISSTELRGMLARGCGEEELCPSVYGYILRRGLYGTHRDLRSLTLNELRCVAMSMLHGKRIPHVLGVEETAAQLARRWGVSEDTARRAALLHDCTKKLTREQHLALCRQYGVETDEVEEREEQLLHAASGAAVAYHVFGLDREGASAIRWHTVGKKTMTTLEKILYLADYIEPTRDFTDLTEHRRLAMEDLDAATELALTTSIRHLETAGKPIHPNSVSAREYLKGKQP